MELQCWEDGDVAMLYDMLLSGQDSIILKQK